MNHLPEDQRVFDLLEEYLRQLHAGQKPDRESFVRAHPDLASVLDCLDVLDALAPPQAEDVGIGPLSPSEPDRLQGNDFGPYELLEEIGRGGMGVVYKARQKALDRTVAIKMILASHLASAEHVSRFQAEAKAAARLQHSNIVRIHEVGQCHGQHYFAMEFVEGISLAQRLEQGPVEPHEAVCLLLPVARAVAHLHAQGVVHRDLKPSNILLDKQGQPYVTDFGLAKVFAADSERTATGVIAGTPTYMAPEQAAGRREAIGPASDVYSLGAILYELLTGRPPLREETPLETVLAVISREPTLPRRLNPRIPRGLELICLKCLAKTPDGRYASAEALAEDLERFSRGEALQARPLGPLGRVWRWSRRQPALAARLGALAAFYAVETVNYATGVVDARFHWGVTVLVAVWAVASIVFQRLLDSRRWSMPAGFGWGVIDSALLLAILLWVADGAASALVVGYPLLIVASGLWFRVRFVTWMTILSLISYGILTLDFYFWRPDVQARFPTDLTRHILFALALVVEGVVVGYLVQRVRDLMSYYGRT